MKVSELFQTYQKYLKTNTTCAAMCANSIMWCIAGPGTRFQDVNTVTGSYLERTVLPANCALGELSYLQTVLLVNCPTCKLCSWQTVLPANCALGELSCQQTALSIERPPAATPYLVRDLVKFL